MHSVLSPLFLSLAFVTDTLIILLSKTKMSNMSNNIRYVNLNGKDLLSDFGLGNLTGSRSVGIMIMRRHIDCVVK